MRRLRRFLKDGKVLDTPDCQTTPEGRTLKGRHWPDCPDPAGCPGCQPCQELHCVVCRRLHVTAEAQVCPTCLHVARLNLSTVARLHARLRGEAIAGRGMRPARGSVPGGDALVLLAPGAEASGYRAQLRARRDRGEPVDHALEERRDDPRPPVAVLVGYTPSHVPAGLPEVTQWLGEHLHELAVGLAFVPLALDLARLARALENVLHDGDRPDTTRVPCWDCGTRLVKVYARDPDDDHWVCPSCYEKYDAGRYARTKADHLASDGAERYVMVPLAAAVIGRSVYTLRQWIKDGRVASDRDTASGRIVVWWPHVRAMHLAAQERRRQKRETARDL